MCPISMPRPPGRRAARRRATASSSCVPSGACRAGSREASDVMSDGDEQARSMADAVARRSYGKLVAFLASRTRDVAAAEDALSEAFAAALADWPVNGCPANPEGWLLTVARRKVIDMYRAQRRDENAGEELRALGFGLETSSTAAPIAYQDGTAIPDQRLALMFACAHPAN